MFKRVSCDHIKHNFQGGTTHDDPVKYYAQISLQIWQNSVCTGQVSVPLITQQQKA